MSRVFTLLTTPSTQEDAANTLRFPLEDATFFFFFFYLVSHEHFGARAAISSISFSKRSFVKKLLSPVNQRRKINE